jgi:isovaleryl-CoA dehydrogenase
LKGFSTAQKLDKLGMRGSNTCELVFEDCEVPPRTCPGARRRRRQRADERPRLRARGAGRRAARHHAGVHGSWLPYVHERKQFGQAIGEFQLMQGKLADMYTTMNACRAYVYAVAQACDARRETTRKDAAGAILYAAEKATWMAGEAIQCLGGNGYINEYPTGRLLRDAKLYEIGAGTSEIRRWLIGREDLTMAAIKAAKEIGYRKLLLDTLPAMRVAVQALSRTGFQGNAGLLPDTS